MKVGTPSGFSAAKSKNPIKTLPLALFSGMMIIIGAYAVVNFTYLYVLPIDQLISATPNAKRNSRRGGGAAFCRRIPAPY
jgi:amino acid transporter